MLQLHRPLHLSIHAAGHLTTDLSLPSMPSKERFSLQMRFSTVFLHLAVSVTASLSPPTDPHPVIRRLRFSSGRFLPTPSGLLARPTWGAQALPSSSVCPLKNRKEGALPPTP